MKRSFIITLALIAAIAGPPCASSGWARGLGVLAMGGGGVAADPCAGYLLCEDFGAQPAGWTTNSSDATIAWDDTTTPIHSGSAYLSIAYGTNQAIIYIPLGGVETDIYTSARVRIDALPAANTSLFLVYSGASLLGGVKIWTNGKVEVSSPGGTSQTSSSAVFTSGSSAYLQVRYAAGGGGDAVMTVWISSSGASGTWTQVATSTNGTATAPATVLRINHQNSMSSSLDALRQSTSFINY